MDQLSSLQIALFSLSKRFVGQQSIVLDAMRDLRPDIIMPIENRGNSKEWLKLRLEYSRKSQTGYWGDNNQWEYYVHGRGCKLTNRQTGEIIQWDAGDLNIFNLDWFVIYLQWLLNRDTDDEAIKTVRSLLRYSEPSLQPSREIMLHQRLALRAQILPILEELCAKGLLTGNTQQTHYRLPSST